MSGYLRPTSSPHGIMFHHFHDQRQHLASQGSISAPQLAHIIDHIGPERILTPEQWIHKANRHALTPQDFCLTFDDNLKSQFDIARPVLEQYQLKAFFFVYTGVYTGLMDKLELYRHFREHAFGSINEFYQAFFDRLFALPEFSALQASIDRLDHSQYKQDYLFYTLEDRKFRYVRDEVLTKEQYYQFMDSWLDERDLDRQAVSQQLWFSPEQIKTLHTSGHMIGLHSHTHPTKLELLSPKAQRQEFLDNYDFLHTLLQTKPVSVAYPSGSYNAATLDLLTDLQVQVGFTDNLYKTGNQSNLEFPRENHTNIVKELAHEATCLH